MLNLKKYLVLIGLFLTCLTSAYASNTPPRKIPNAPLRASSSTAPPPFGDDVNQQQLRVMGESIQAIYRQLQLQKQQQEKILDFIRDSQNNSCPRAVCSSSEKLESLVKGLETRLFYLIRDRTRVSHYIQLGGIAIFLIWAIFF